MTLTLFYLPVCPFCRSVLMLARELGVDLVLKSLDLSKKEHMTPEYLAMNPAHTVPLLLDDGNDVKIFESRAILKYLVDKCAPDHSMYPKDLKRRAVIDNWLFFDCGTVVPASRLLLKPFMNHETPSHEAVNQVHEVLKIVEQMRGDTEFLTGDKMTIADLDLLISMDFPVELTNLDLSPFVKLHAWYNRMKSLPYYESISGTKIRELKQKKENEKKVLESVAGHK